MMMTLLKFHCKYDESLIGTEPAQAIAQSRRKSLAFWNGWTLTYSKLNTQRYQSLNWLNLNGNMSVGQNELSDNRQLGARGHHSSASITWYSSCYCFIKRGFVFFFASHRLIQIRLKAHSAKSFTVNKIWLCILVYKLPIVLISYIMPIY